MLGHIISIPCKILFITFVFCIFSSSVIAEKCSTEESWCFSASMYIWATALGGETADGDDIDVSFSDLFDNLNFALMGAGAARKGNWVVLTDVFYADLTVDESITREILNTPVSADLEADLKNWILHFAGGYSISRSNTHNVDVIAGVRYLHLDTDLEIEVGPIEIDTNETDDVLDAIIGVQTYFDLNEKWFLQTHFDVGTGDSDLTWQALGLLGYKHDNVDITLGYRHIKWEFGSSDSISETFDELEYTGPMLGARFHF